ncbi:MAG: hypothetical protein J6W60_10995, partial [Treponema sp.]|nr:hypothetical protein [Treponema sp.]
FKANGSMVKSDYVTVDEYTYYMDGEGKAITGFMSKWSSKYYFDEKCHQVKDNFFEADGNTYYADAKGQIQTQTWITAGDNKYYANAEGIIVKSQIFEKWSKRYIFDNEGVLQTGFVTFNGNDYYGFTALPSRPNGTYAEFWSSTEFPGRCIDKDSIHALYATIYSTEPVPVMTTGMMCGSQNQFFPIRCISNESLTPLDSSTALPAVPPCKTDSTDNCEYGTLKDDRDGQTYKTVKIGNQEWMAENLEYKTDSSFYSHKGLTKYGRYYTWEAALEACPEGWHLPDSTEWATLRESVGEDAAKALSSTTDWKSTALTDPSYYCGTAYIDLVGTDSYGFAVLPAGTYIDDEFDVVRSKTEAWFWTKTEAYHRQSPEPPTSFANVAFFQSDMGIGGLHSKSEKFSVRCIKD